jgi:3-hydroxyisobutyrate dehydrogenase-like beta-hydroxyacid dehydrogenase
MSENQAEASAVFPGVVGVAGCGAMGLPMALRLLKAGVNVYGHDVVPISGPFASRMVSNPAEFSDRCDVVISVVRDIAQTKALLFDKQAIVRGPNPPKMIVICSTLSPRYMRLLRADVPAPIALVDAPMSGAPYGAEHGTLTFMAGGDREHLQLIKPLLLSMGIDIHHMGGLSAGMTAKVLNNLVAASNVAATRRALTAADALGLPRDALLAVMEASSGQNWFASNIGRISWAQEKYDPNNTMGILEKDVESMIDGVADAALSEPLLERGIIGALRNL